MLTWLQVNNGDNSVKYSFLKSKSFLIPTISWSLFVLIVVVAFTVGETKYNSLARTLIQWDGQHYFTIAYDGYERFPCPGRPSLVCGNVGWFPLYPISAAMVGKLLSPLRIEMRWVMIITSLIFFWLALLALFRLVAMKFGELIALLTIVALLLFPTSFYYATAFPYSLYLLLVVVTFLLLETRQYLWSAVPSGLLAVTYPSGIVIVLPLLWTLVVGWKTFDTKQRLALTTACSCVGLALVAYCAYYWWQFDDFWLYFRFQAKPYYHHEAAFPVVTIVRFLIYLPTSNPVYVMFLFIIATITVFYRRVVPVSWQLLMFGVLLFTPTAGTMVCYYRHIVVAFPLFVMIALAIQTRRKWLLLVYGITSLTLAWFVFLKAYKLGMLM